MKNSSKQSRQPVGHALTMALAAFLPLVSCDLASVDSPEDISAESSLYSRTFSMTPQGVADLITRTRITPVQVQEVHCAVSASAANGYDEEYTFRDLVSNPGAGVGDSRLGTKSLALVTDPLRDALSATLSASSQTKSPVSVEDLASSGLQIYWPYSEDWDGKEMPVVTFNPEDGSESNFGFVQEILPDGTLSVKRVKVDEDYAKKHPVWIVNRNEDASCLTPEILDKISPSTPQTRATASFQTLRIKEFKAHRNYDCFLAGASEFVIKCGAINAFKADVLSDMTMYSPEITDMVIVVKRKQVETYLRLNAILVSEWSSQLEEAAFLMTEDDGGKMTTWKTTGTVMIKSKSYGFTVEFPLNKNDDIVWRGKLSKNYFDKYNGKAGRFGDVSVTFTLD